MMIIDLCLRLNQGIRFSKNEKYTTLIENRETVESRWSKRPACPFGVYPSGLVTLDCEIVELGGVFGFLLNYGMLKRSGKTAEILLILSQISSHFPVQQPVRALSILLRHFFRRECDYRYGQ